uniref:Putative ATP synthase gamma chain n=1 Tax=uncultured bacterium CBNPD1 BAC clone 2089 TaxID=417311 RepID=B1N6Q3_9BACT|nr:putative ATP synthase gamma chain [uncultured bacterium CBNPD1 BAC clone 2089]
MAGGQERILRGRIRSVQATKKITRAMELIAASRIVKAQQRVAAAVPYSEKITEVVKHLSDGGAVSQSPFLAGRSDVKTTCYVAITADRGLCGGYNSGVLRATEGRSPQGRRGGQELHDRSGRPKGRGLPPIPRIQHQPALRGFLRQPNHHRCGGNRTLRR